MVGCSSLWRARHGGVLQYWELRTVQQIEIGWLLRLPFLFTLGYLPMGWYYTHSEGSSHNLNPYGNNFTDTSGNEPSRAFLTQPSDNEDLPPQCHAWCSSLMSAFPLSQFFFTSTVPVPSLVELLSWQFARVGDFKFKLGGGAEGFV